VRVLAVGALFVVVVVAATYAVETFAPGISLPARCAVMVPVYVGGGWCVRAAAVRRRLERAHDPEA